MPPAEDAAEELYGALKAAERGSNEDGPYWNTADLVAALRVFYAAMEADDGET